MTEMGAILRPYRTDCHNFAVRNVAVQQLMIILITTMLLKAIKNKFEAAFTPNL
jgi:hypothetical protein